MNIAFTGHRPDKLGGYDNRTNKHDLFIFSVIDVFPRYDLIENSVIISGMALGVDTWAAEFAISHNIPFLAYVPFKGQEKKWPEESQRQYHEILSKAEGIKYICSNGYAPWKMQKRNEAMVNDCDILIAFWDGSSGGTKNCVEYAKKKKKKIIYIDSRS